MENFNIINRCCLLWFDPSGQFGDFGKPVRDNRKACLLFEKAGERFRKALRAFYLFGFFKF